ncbi:unnamed protein product [Miscanthus lutarioriparius]|uniref:Uncharacterized protein n=1 Tax=Miscanthus lutarioriparius TaxID=422564 RepID=A0A811P6B4_9POAL|nr:unnamed protein product [Miscanthus lutarioriparius]
MLQGYGHLFSLSLSPFQVGGSAPWSWAFQLLSNAAAGAATVSDLIKEIGLVPAKAPYLSRLLRFLAFFGLFQEDDDESASAESQTVYKLTPTSRLLVQEADNDSTCDLSHMLLLFTRPSTTVSTFFDLERWFRDPTSTKTVFEAAHGTSTWSLTQSDASFNDAMNRASVADSRFTMEVVIKEAGGYFKGLKTLTDVGGGHGCYRCSLSGHAVHRDGPPASGHGFERDERQWKTIFLEAGFANYTVIPLQDPLAMIVLHLSPLVVETTVKVTGAGGAKEDSFLSTDEAEAAP